MLDLLAYAVLGILVGTLISIAVNPRGSGQVVDHYLRRWKLRRQLAEIPKPTDRESSLAAIRMHYAQMGMPLDDLSDEQLEANVAAMAKAAQAATVAAAEMAASMSAAFRAMDAALPTVEVFGRRFQQVEQSPAMRALMRRLEGGQVDA